MATDAELNEYVGLKKIAPYRKNKGGREAWDSSRGERLKAFKESTRWRAWGGVGGANGKGGGEGSGNGVSRSGDGGEKKKRKGKKEREKEKAAAAATSLDGMPAQEVDASENGDAPKAKRRRKE